MNDPVVEKITFKFSPGKQGETEQETKARFKNDFRKLPKSFKKHVFNNLKKALIDL